MEWIRTSPEPKTAGRLLAAALTLGDFDSTTLRANLTRVVERLPAPSAGTPQHRYDTAALIGEQDRELGNYAMRLLAHTGDMDELRVDAAMRTGSPELLAELVEGDRTMPDEARLRLGAELLTLDSTRAVPMLERFAETASSKDTPLRIAELLATGHPDAAVRIADDLAHQREARSGVRLQAVIRIGRLDPVRKIPMLKWFSEQGSADGGDRVHAATLIVEEGGPITALVNLAEDPGLGRTHRTDAAEAAGKADHVDDARLLMVIARTSSTTSDRTRLSLLKKAYALDPEPAAEALAELAADRNTSGPIRLEAVETAASVLPTRRKLELYTGIAAVRDNHTAAMTAARRVKLMDRPAGERVMAKLAERGGADTSFRLTAALEAGARGKSILTTLARTARSDDMRIKAAVGLRAIDTKAGNAELWRMVRNSRGRGIRITAAMTLPDISVVDALLEIMNDRRGVDSIRVEAGKTAMDRGGKRVRRDFAALGDDRSLSATAREDIRRYLARHR